MKTIIKYLFVTCVLASCTEARRGFDTEVSIIIDRTDPVSVVPSAQGITESLALDQNPWRGYRVVLSHISDVALNDHTVIDLEPENEWSGNKLLRAATIARFKKHLQRSLDTMKSSGTCNHSIIFQTVAAEANRLAASGAATKYLIVVSDLMEHSTVSFYDRTTLTTLQSNPDRITKQLETITPLSSLANMQVWLLNSPGSYEQNTTYMIVAGFYKHLLEAKGAQVHIDTKFQAL